MDIIKHFWYLIHVERQKEIVTAYALTSQMTPMKTIRRRLLQLFTYELAVDIFMLQYILVQYQINLHSLQDILEKLARGSLFYLFLKLVRINYIFSDNLRTLYIYRQVIMWLTSHWPIIFKIISSPLTIKISMGEIKGKLYRLPLDENIRSFS